MDKEGLFKKVVDKTKAKAEKEEKRIKEIQEAINKAPDYRQTWSDTTKFQLRQLKNNLTDSHQKTKKALRALSKIDQGKQEKIGVGSLVEMGENPLFYFILPSGSFQGKIKIENRPVVIISPGSPLGREMTGRKEGETFKWKKQTFSIQTIL